jgi:hypothetical protein
MSIRIPHENMELPKIEKKLINVAEFKKNAEKVRKSLEEERDFLIEKKLKNGNTVSSDLINFS